jgi:hypothetical protein
MQVETNATVTYDVKKVAINSITVQKMGNTLTFMIPYEWLDSDGKKIEQSMKRLTQAELVALGTAIGQDVTPIVTVLNKILSNGAVNLRIDLTKAPVLSAMIIARVDGKYVQNKMDNTALATAISPVPIATIIGLIQMISVQLTA